MEVRPIESSPLMDVLERLKQVREEIRALIERTAVIFIDMAESTTYKDERGIELGVEKVIGFNLDVTNIINEKGEEFKRKGEIEKYEICKYIGDETMAYFKGKNSSKAAIEVAVEIETHFKEVNSGIKDEFEKYKPKIGIDFGETLFAQYYQNSPLDPHGPVVDRAARIISLAKPFQIVISEEAKNHAEGKVGVRFGEKEMRKLKGIKENVAVYEVVWNKELGINVEEEPSVFMISADEPTVHQFMKESNLLERSNQIDLLLYTYETLASALRYDLLKFQKPITFRIIIRNPLKDPKKEPFIKSSIATMVEIISMNPKISFNVRFYDDEPLLRTYIFHKEDGRSEGLLSLYKFDPRHPWKFVGAEYNRLIYTRGKSLFEEHLLDLFQSRFDYYWEKLTEKKAVIFDLDGVIIDSMPFYYEAWKHAFAVVGIDVSKEDIYEREGEKREITAREIYNKYKKKEPSESLIRRIVAEKEKIYHKIFEFRVFPGVKETLDLLKAKNIKLGLVTGSVSKTIGKLKEENNSLFTLFDVIVTGEDTRNGKPSPEPYLIAVERLNVPAHNCYVVENAPLGIKSATDADLMCFAVRGSSVLSENVLKEAGADFVYKDVQEMKRHLIWIDTNIHFRSFLEIFNI